MEKSLEEMYTPRLAGGILPNAGCFRFGALVNYVTLQQFSSHCLEQDFPFISGAYQLT